LKSSHSTCPKSSQESTPILRDGDASSARAFDLEAIAVVGIGCRFPGADGPDAFWSLLWQGTDAVSEVAPDRWDRDAFYDPEPNSIGKMITRCGGFLDQIDQFDPDFFDMDPREAKRVDPQQRLMLEVAWESLEDAGIVPSSLAGSQTGVFIGIRQTDYNRYLYGDLARIDGKNPDNSYPCIVANRISNLLDLHGPSLAVDTACSSSLVSVHLACQSLRVGESNLALAGGVNLNLFPEESISRSLAGMVAPSGRCRAFDASADGYVIGEGSGAVVLKRLSDARADGDNILAVIRGSAVNHNGLSYRLTAYNGLSQQALLHSALADAKVAPQDVSYVEANGLGSFAGDPIELKALKMVFAPDSLPDRPKCFVASVKTNIGHLEGAAGIASLIKVVLSLQHEGIPPHLHLTEINPNADLGDSSLTIPTEAQPWPRGNEPRFAGVSAFGLGGANAHMIVSEAPELVEVTDTVERPWHVMTLSAKSSDALEALAMRYRVTLAEQPPNALADVCFSANVGREHYPYRMAVVADSTEAMSAGLRGADDAGSERGPRVLTGQVRTRRNPKVAFLFPAAGPDLVQAGRELYRTQPTFRGVVDRCSAVAEPLTGHSLAAGLGGGSDGGASDSGDRVERCIWFAVQLGLAELLRSWSAAPTWVLGEGVGEWVAACLAGACGLEEAVTSVAREPVRTLADSLPGASVASAQKGTPELVPVSSSSDVMEALERLAGEGCALFVEIGSTSFRTRVADSNAIDNPGAWLAASSLDDGAWQNLLVALGTLYVRGVPIDWANFDRDYQRRHIRAPTYPFQRQRLWFETTELASEKRTESETEALLIELFEGDETTCQGLLWGATPDPAKVDVLKQQVRRLRLDQAWDLLGKSVEVAKAKSAQIGPDGGRDALRRQVESLDMQQLREMVVESVEALWHHDDLLEAYLRRRLTDREANHGELEQIRAALVYMGELLRRKDHLLK